MDKKFKENLAKLIIEFTDFQLQNHIPYSYDLLGLQQWLLFDNGLNLLEGDATDKKVQG